MSLRTCVAFILALASAAGAHGAELSLWVGTHGRTCNHATIQAAIDAASANPADVTTIHISGGQTYTEDLTIVGKNVRLVGSASSCGPYIDPLPRPIVSGAGGARRSILNLRGTTAEVAIRNLILRDGDELTDTDSYGGAVDITEGPHALVYLENTQINAGTAGWGGALSIRNGDAGRPQDIVVRFGPNNLIFNNVAHFGGGGIYCRDATLDLNGSNNLVTGNYAGDNLGNGGGLYLDDCFVKLASDSDAGVVNNNTARAGGGGVFVKGEHARLDIYNIDADHPTRIKDNVAGSFGGGIDIESGNFVHAWDVIIEGNRAGAGGGGVALYSYADAGYLGTDSAEARFLATSELSIYVYYGYIATAPVDAVLCRLREQCNAFLGNVAADENGSPRDGAAIRVSSDVDGVSPHAYSQVKLETPYFSENFGRNLFFVRSWEDDAFAWIDLYSAVISGNTVSGNLIEVLGDDSDVELSQNTIAYNTIGGAGVAKFEDAPQSDNQSEDNKFLGNIVWQPGKLFFVNAPLQVVARFNIVNEQSVVPASERPFNLEGYPLFRAPADHDYRLLTGSPALDFAQFSVPFTRDGGPRSIDLPSVPNVAGPVDAGAYELDRTNAQPTGNHIELETALNTPLAITLSGNDPDNDPITFRVVEAPLHGALSGTPPDLTYTPTNNYLGADLFRFVVNDGMADSLPVRVDIEVMLQPNRPPVANSQQLSTPQATPLAIVLTATDADGDALIYGIATAPAHGSLSGTAPNLTYTPAAGFTGIDTFTFQALDAQSSSAAATVSISVTPSSPGGDGIFGNGFECGLACQ